MCAQVYMQVSRREVGKQCAFIDVSFFLPNSSDNARAMPHQCSQGCPLMMATQVQIQVVSWRFDTHWFFCAWAKQRSVEAGASFKTSYIPLEHHDRWTIIIYYHPSNNHHLITSFMYVYIYIYMCVCVSYVCVCIYVMILKNNNKKQL